ncbi:MAG: PQQ-dependent dehydrogenase, methanol/ethanol family [Gemmatimonadota bacterium]
MKRRLLHLTLPFAMGLTAFPADAQWGRNVDDEALANPNRTEWLTNGRDFAEQRFSPLDQINAGNVSRLGLAWSYEIGSPQGQLEATPLVSDGIMYATGTWSVVFALDARTGEEIWRWDPGIIQGGLANGGPSICCGPANRGVALYEGKIYAGLLDGRLVALDAETGRLVWARQTVPPGDEYSITGAPRIVRGKVVIGNGGAEYGVRGYVTAYDAETGEEVWRFYTVPGDPSLGFESFALEMAASTWAGNWWELGGGGTVWDAIAYDPEANLVYIGVGNGSPWSREHRSAGQGDNLFLASIVALNGDTGEMAWYYQTAPGDDWDYTATQHIMLADLVINGEERRVLMQAPKNGFFYVLDRITGEFISAQAIAHVTWASHVDPTTGRPVETPEARYDEVGAYLAPGPRGAHNWEPMSFNPEVGLVFISGQNTQSFYRRNTDFVIRPGQFNTGTGGGGGRGGVTAPPAPQPAGFLLGWDPVAQEERWRIPYESSRNGGTLSTAGGLLFSARNDGRFYAHDPATGRILWEAEIARGPGAMMTYELDGRQYVTMLTGPGGANGPSGRVLTFALDGNASMPND